MNDILNLCSDPIPPTTDPAPLLADARRLAALLCAGVRTIRSWDTGGRLPEPLRISGKVLWNIQEIRAWLAAGTPNREVWAKCATARK